MHSIPTRYCGEHWELLRTIQSLAVLSRWTSRFFTLPGNDWYQFANIPPRDGRLRWPVRVPNQAHRFGAHKSATASFDCATAHPTNIATTYGTTLSAVLLVNLKKLWSLLFWYVAALSVTLLNLRSGQKKDLIHTGIRVGLEDTNSTSFDSGGTTQLYASGSMVRLRYHVCCAKSIFKFLSRDPVRSGYFSIFNKPS